METLLTVKEVAGITRLATSSIYSLIAQKAIPHLKMGSRVLFSPSELESWVESKRQPSGLSNPVSPSR